MKFEILNEVEFTEFANNHEMGSFHQNVAWGELKGFTGWKTHLVGVKNDGKIVAATLILSKMTPIKKNMFYAPRGFLIDYSDKVLLKFFVDNLKKYCKQNKGIFIKFDPYVEYQQRDINGDIVVDGYNNDYVVANLKELGCKHHGFTKKMEDMQPRFIFTLTTKGKSVEDIMEVMDSKTRQILRKNERMGVVVREIDVDELDKFHDIM